VGKRFSETSKWSDPWFRGLSPGRKLAWLYLIDNCDMAGVIDLDQALANFQIGGEVNWPEFLAVAGEGRIETLPNGKLFIVKFIEFQHGTLSENCKAHGPAFRSLESNGIFQRVSKGVPKGMDTLKVKVKVKEEVKEKVKVKVKESEFELFWGQVPEGRKIGVAGCRKHYERIVKEIKTDDPHAFLRDRWTTYAKSPKAQSDYAWEPLAWLRDGHYADDPESWNRAHTNNHKPLLEEIPF